MLTMNKVLKIVEAMTTYVIEGPRLRKMLADNGAFETYVNTTLSSEMDAVVVRLVALFAAEDIKNVEVKYPATWWDAFKEAYAPQPWLDRWPVKYKHVTADIKAIWAHFTDKAKGAWRDGHRYLPYTLVTTSDDRETYD